MNKIEDFKSRFKKGDVLICIDDVACNHELLKQVEYIAEEDSYMFNFWERVKIQSLNGFKHNKDGYYDSHFTIVVDGKHGYIFTNDDFLNRDEYGVHAFNLSKDQALLLLAKLEEIVTL